MQNRRDEDFLMGKGFRHAKWIPLAVHPEIMAAGRVHRSKRTEIR